MPVALHANLDSHLQKVLGQANFTVSGATATLPAASLSHQRLSELLDVANLIKHDVKLAAGVLTVVPR